MSWMKRPPGGAPQPAPDPSQPYAAPLAAPQPQLYGNQQPTYQNYAQGAVPNNTQPQQQYWQTGHQQTPAAYNQQYGQVYQPQDQYAANNANQGYQQYNQNYTSQNYNAQQQTYPQNYYANQGPPPQYPQNAQKKDAWEDNWDWGWEEAAKQQAHQQALPTQPAAPQQPAFNNANVLEESFVSSDTWNWSMEDKKDTHQQSQPASIQQEVKSPPTLPVENIMHENNISDVQQQKSISNMTSHSATEEVRTLNDKDIIKERLPNLALGKRLGLDNLTPQWSIESQMSQESSDGPQTHSESTYPSENQSRNSNSSPCLNLESYSYPHSSQEESLSNTEWSRKSEEHTITDNHQADSRQSENHDEIANSLQEMSIANRENLTPDSIDLHQDDINQMADNIPPPPVAQIPMSQPPPSFLPPPSSISLPPPPPLSSTSSSASQSSAPPNFSSSSTNPFKHAGPFSHKATSRPPNSTSPFPPVPKDVPNQTSANLASPAAVNKVHHNRSMGFGANLETAPDNSERPDQPQVSAFRPLPIPPAQAVPENLEVAPRNDRNEYLQTAHLSGADYGENTDFSRNAPPPGFRRMVVGQQETEYRQNLNISGDEPPPGLARMVPGQQTETDNTYSQSNDNYMDRQIDGQPTDGAGRPYRQADGQQTPDNFPQVPSRGGRPVGLDRMVPGEPSNEEFSLYQNTNFTSNEQRVVTGLDHEYNAGPSDIREQNMDGSDYSEHVPRSSRTISTPREAAHEVPVDFGVSEDQQREVTMEGENLQDISAVSSAEPAFLRDHTFDGADINEPHNGMDRKTDLSDSIEAPASSSRRQSLNRLTSGEDSDRDRAFKTSPRRERDKHKSSRDRDRDRHGRYPREDKKKEREPERRSERRTDKERRDRDKERLRDRRDRDESPDDRRHKRSTRSRRDDTEDTDYSDRERERRRHTREGSYASGKPPRPDDKDRRYRDDRDRDRTRRYNTIERDRRYDDDRDAATRSRRSDRDRDRYDRSYRDIDPTRKHGNIRREEERRRGDAYGSPSRADSREAARTDDDLNDTLASTHSQRRGDRVRRSRPRHDPYYDAYGAAAAYSDPYALQRQQYQYYEQLRLSNPAAYMEVYKKLMAGQQPPYIAPSAMLYEGYGSLGYEGRPEERGSVHSGRSSAAGKDTYYLGGAGAGGGAYGAHSLQDAPSLRTDLSDRDFNTDVDASLNLHLDESTVRSERMTPFKFSTAHIKGNISSRNIVVVRPSYPVDGLPATVHILEMRSALQRDVTDLADYPGPLVKGVTHKKSVIEYCESRVRLANQRAPHDVIGYVLIWELLALLLRQSGMVVGTDIAELLMKNKRDYEYKTQSNKESRRGSSASGDARDDPSPPDRSPDQPLGDVTPQDEESSSMTSGTLGASLRPRQGRAADEASALDTLRQCLIVGDRQQALEWCMSCGLWGHALQLSLHVSRRSRAAVQARFLAALPAQDPLHSLYAHLAARQPPAATCVSEERWGDWRPHAAVVLANASAKPEQDRQTLIQMGDSLASRGLRFCAQFCYLSAGVELSRHPLAPLQQITEAPAAAAAPRLALLLADHRAPTLGAVATNEAVFATEIYEYAMSLNQEFVLTELQVYKFLLASRLVDAGLYERALAYTELVARELTRYPAGYSRQLIARVADLADRLKYHDPALHEEPPLGDELGGDSGEPSPRHHQQWLDDVKSVALTQSASPQNSPLHAYYQQQQPGGWDHAHQVHQPYQHDTSPYPAAPADEAAPPHPHPPPLYPAEPAYQQYHDWQHTADDQAYARDEQAYSQEAATYRQEEPAPGYADGAYWPGDASYGYSEAADGGGETQQPTITMPGAPPSRPQLYSDYDDDRPHSEASQNTDREDGVKSNKPGGAGAADPAGKGGRGGGGGWLGGLFNKLTLRPPNQMILPDDKNPSIVWDADSKRWRNLDSTEDEATAAPPPPPKMADIVSAMQKQPAPAPAALPSNGAPPPAPASAAPQSNIFKMQKGRYIKKSYVDVFNPSGAPTRALPPAADVLGPPPAAPSAAPLTYFTPQSGIYTPLQPTAEQNQ